MSSVGDEHLYGRMCQQSDNSQRLIRAYLDPRAGDVCFKSTLLMEWNWVMIYLCHKSQPVKKHLWSIGGGWSYLTGRMVKYALLWWKLGRIEHHPPPKVPNEKAYKPVRGECFIWCCSFSLGGITSDPHTVNTCRYHVTWLTENFIIISHSLNLSYSLASVGFLGFPNHLSKSAENWLKRVFITSSSLAYCAAVF